MFLLAYTWWEQNTQTHTHTYTHIWQTTLTPTTTATIKIKTKKEFHNFILITDVNFFCGVQNANSSCFFEPKRAIWVFSPRFWRHSVLRSKSELNFYFNRHFSRTRFQVCCCKWNIPIFTGSTTALPANWNMWPRENGGLAETARCVSAETLKICVFVFSKLENIGTAYSINFGNRLSPSVIIKC